MKRILLLCLTISLMCIMFCCPTSAEEYTTPYDARNVPDEVAELLPNYENAEMIYQYFVRSPMYAGGIGSIDGVEQDLADRIPCYAVVTSDKKNFYIIQDGMAVDIGWSSVDSFSQQLSTHEAIRTVSPDICLESVYYFHYSEYGVSDLTILYKTNLGDFVYFRTEQTSPMLMTVRRYDEYIAAWTEYRHEMNESEGYLMGGRYVLHIDSSSYDWTSPDFDPDAPLPIEKEGSGWLIVGVGAVVLAAAVVTVLIIRKKKKKTAPEETEEIPEET